MQPAGVGPSRGLERRAARRGRTPQRWRPPGPPPGRRGSSRRARLDGPAGGTAEVGGLEDRARRKGRPAGRAMGRAVPEGGGLGVERRGPHPARASTSTFRAACCSFCRSASPRRRSSARCHRSRRTSSPSPRSSAARMAASKAPDSARQPASRRSSSVATASSRRRSSASKPLLSWRPARIIAVKRLSALAGRSAASCRAATSWESPTREGRFEGSGSGVNMTRGYDRAR